MNDLIYIGYISGPFGLKGDVKVISDSNHLEKIFKEGNNLVINNKEYKIKKYHFHKHHLITFEEYEDINLINDLIKQEVYLKREDLNLDDGEYLLADLIGCNLIEDKDYGIISDVLYNKHTIFIKIDNLIVPMNEKYIEKVDTKEKKVYGKNIKELMLWK